MLAEVRAPGKASRFSPAEKADDARTGIAATSTGHARQVPVVGLLENGTITPSPVACLRLPAVGRVGRLGLVLKASARGFCPRARPEGPLGWTARMANFNQLRRFVSRGWQASAIWRGARYFVYNRRLMLSQEPAE